MLVNSPLYRECPNDENECACANDTDFFDDNGEPIFGCPWRRLENPEMCNEFMRWYQAYRSGFLLLGGGWGDQPAWWTDGIGIIDAEQNHIDAANQKASRDSFKREYGL